MKKLFNGLETDYLDGFQYKFTQAWEDPNGTMMNDEMKLRIIPTAEGYFDALRNAYFYNYTDHLGNVRLSYSDRDENGEVTGDIVVNNCYTTPDGQMCNNYILTGEAEGVTSYYPFGMMHTIEYNTFDNAYLYKYNGKELQETGIYDYGARFYMPDIGRWGVVDPLAESSRRFTPYHYGNNNPVRFIDPDGRLTMDNLTTYSHGSAVADFINKNGFGDDYLPMFYRDDAGVMIVNQSLGNDGQGGGGGSSGMTMGDLIDAWVANNGSSDAFYFMFAGPEALSDDQYKATQKAYNNFVREEKYMDAVNLVITAFSLDALVKGHYSINVVNEASKNGDYEPWMTTDGGAFENQSIEINRPVFSGNRGWGYGGVVRSIYHEFVHVVQKSILGLYNDNNEQLGLLREYWAYKATINANHLPPARNSIMTSWRTSAETYYNEMNSVYKLQTKVPFLFVKP